MNLIQLTLTLLLNFPLLIRGNELYTRQWVKRNLQDIQQCLTNQFLNNDLCENCHYSCLECSSSGSSSCLSCLSDSNRLLENSVCKCKGNYYDENNEYFCQRTIKLKLGCRFPCLDCLGKGEEDCLSCQNQMILQGNKCKCGEHQFFNYVNFVCEDCHPTCQECFGSLDSNCVKCKEDKKTVLESNICICKDGYYRSNIDYDCYLCHLNCKTCSGPGDNECLSCDNNNKIGNSCSCVIGYYTQLISTFKQCWKCHSICASCDGQGEFNCLTCHSNATLQVSSQMCICNSGYVWNGDMCVQCDSICSGMCRYNSSNCCIAPCAYCLNPQCSDCDASLVCTICPAGKSGVNCDISCDANCKTCDISSPNTCTSCDTPKILNSGLCDCPTGQVLQITSCVNGSCPSTCTSTGCIDGYYGYNCASTCHSSCRKCYGGSDQECNKCQNNAYVGSNNKCQCFFGYYMDATFNCFKCHYTCRECSSYTQCTNCENSFRLLNLSLNECECISGYYDYGVRLCQQNCGLFCGSCNELHPGYQCQACALNNTYRNNDLANNCPCQAGYFDNGTQICEQCNYKCSTCDNSISCIQCESNRDLINDCNCDSGYEEQSQNCVVISPSSVNIIGINYDSIIMQEYLSENCQLTNFADKVKCECLDGYFMKNSKCLPCHRNCKTCSIFSTNCLECSFNMINPPTCSCVNGYQLIDEVCISCEYQCLFCSNNVCTTCISPLILDDDNTCQCSTGYYLDPISKLCNNCQIQCNKCKYQSDYCIQCNFNRILPYKCICPQGTYELSLSQPCQNCSKRCFTCEIDSNNCTTCATLRINLPSCQCKDGYFEDSYLNCLKCHKKCKTCQISSNNCLECSIYRSNSQCQCIDGYYENNNDVCIQCHKNCKTCYGADEYNCFTCDQTRNFILSNSTCICQKGYYYENNQCLPCIFDIISCQTNYCGDGIKQPQEKCDDWNILNRDGCNSKCQIEDGYTCTLIQNLQLSTLIYYSQCTQCTDVNCKSCIDLKICSICKEGYFLDDNQCHPCDHRCKECTGPSKTQCKSCLFDIFSSDNCLLCEDTPGLYLQDEKCISICGDGIIIRFTEQCDDGNNFDGDGCSSICKNEQSWLCNSNNHTESKCYITDSPQAKISFQNPSNIYQSSRQGVIQFNKIMNIDLFQGQQLWIQQIKNINLLNYFIEFKQISIVDNSYSQINFSINFYQTSQNMIYQINFTEYLPYDQEGQQLTSKFLEYSIEDFYKVTELQITTAATSKKIIYCFLAALGGAAFLGLFLQSLEFYWNTLDMLQVFSYLSYINVKFPYLHLEFLSIFQFSQFDFLNNLIPSIFIQLGENEVQHNYPLLIERDVQENLFFNLSSIMVSYVIPVAIFLGSKLITKLNYNVLLNKILISNSTNLGPCQIKFYIYQLIYYANKAANIYENSFLFQIILRVYISSLFDLNFGIFTTVYCWTQHKQITQNDNLQYLFANILIIIQILIIIVSCNSMLIRRFQFKSLQFKQKYGSLFDGFQIDSIHNRQAAFFQLFKKILFMASLLVFFNEPLYQIGLLTTLQMTSAIISIYLQPNVNNLEISKAIIQDLGILISLNFITVYYVQDNFNYFSQDTIEFISYFHIGIYILMLILQIIIDCYQQIKLLLEKYPNLKKCSTKKDDTNIKSCNSNYYVRQQFIIIQPTQRPPRFIP